MSSIYRLEIPQLAPNVEHVVAEEPVEVLGAQMPAQPFGAAGR